MNKYEELTQKELMKIIVHLNTSHKKEVANLKIELECKTNIMKNNELGSLEYIEHCNCENCGVILNKYSYKSIDDDTYYEPGEPSIENEMFKCRICDKKFCQVCNHRYYHSDNTCYCDDCHEIREEAKKIEEIMTQIDIHL